MMSWQSIAGWSFGCVPVLASWLSRHVCALEWPRHAARAGSWRAALADAWSQEGSGWPLAREVSVASQGRHNWKRQHVAVPHTENHR